MSQSTGPQAAIKLAESVRKQLIEEARRVFAQDTFLDIGRTDPPRPMYQLLGVGLASPELLTRCVRITADRARRHWSDVRALARIHDVSFLLTVEGKAIAVVRRHPNFSDPLLDKWLSEHKRLSQAVEGSSGTPPLDVESQLSLLNERISRLEALAGN